MRKAADGFPAFVPADPAEPRRPLGQYLRLRSLRPRYRDLVQRLATRIVTTSTSNDKLTLKCSGAISAAVGDTKATKEVTFTVQQSSDGKLSVSVDPFQFDAQAREGG